MASTALIIANRPVINASEGADVVVLDFARDLSAQGVECHFATLSNHFLRRPIGRIGNLPTEFKTFSVRGCVIFNNSVFIKTNWRDWLRFCLTFIEWRLRGFNRLLKRTVVWRMGERAISKSAPPTFSSEPDELSERAVAKLIRQLHPDLLVVDFPWLSPLLNLAGPEVLKIIYSHESMALRCQSFERAGKVPDLGDWDKERELQSIANSDIVIVETQEEIDYLQQPERNPTVIRMPRHVTALRCEAPQMSNRLLFVGSAAVHNVDAVNWFLANVWELVLAQNPNATLDICGRVAEAIHCQGRNVHLSGFQGDLSSHYASATVVVVPLIAGTGFKTKLAEALAYGRACVATPSGAWGLGDEHKKAVLVATDAPAFATAVLQVLTDVPLRRCMERAALASAVESSSWKNGISHVLESLSKHFVRREMRGSQHCRQ